MVVLKVSIDNIRCRASWDAMFWPMREMIESRGTPSADMLRFWKNAATMPSTSSGRPP